MEYATDATAALIELADGNSKSLPAFSAFETEWSL